MKKLFLSLAVIFAIALNAQETKPVPLVNVAGVGKVKVTPDQVSITVSVESKGVKATDVKKQNDTKIDAVIKYIKKMNIDVKDFQTQRVYLNDEYDYAKKKHNYVATQTIQILLRNLSVYDELMEGLVDQGINNISNVEFKSSKIEEHKSEARKLAIKDAKLKAEDYVSVLNQKVGKAFTITDNSQVYYPIQRKYEMSAMAMDAALPQKETLAIGELDVVVNVSVSFLLD